MFTELTINTIKPLVIGVGSSGRRHLNTQIGMGLETGAFDTNPDAVKQLKSNPRVIVFENLDQAMDWANLAHVCTPDDMHTQFVEKALERNIAVLCEKPFTTNLQDALGIQRLAHQFKTPLFIGHNYRLTPSFLETRRKVLKGQLGTVTYIETTYLHDMTEYQKQTPWRENQDFLYGAGSHAVDLAMWIMNERIDTVQAITGKKIRPEYKMPESYLINLKFASGVLGHIRLDASLARPFHGTDVLVDGSKGRIASHNKVNKLTIYNRSAKKPSHKRFPNSTTMTISEEIKLVDDYLSGKRDNIWPLPQVDEAVDVMRVLDTIYKSTNSGAVEKVTY